MQSSVNETTTGKKRRQIRLTKVTIIDATQREEESKIGSDQATDFDVF